MEFGVLTLFVKHTSLLLDRTLWCVCVFVCVRPLKAKSSWWRLFFFFFLVGGGDSSWYEFGPPPSDYRPFLSTYINVRAVDAVNESAVVFLTVFEGLTTEWVVLTLCQMTELSLCSSLTSTWAAFEEEEKQKLLIFYPPSLQPPLTPT